MGQGKDVIEAAGGILWHPDRQAPMVAVIHRQRYDDWSLPKGKRKAGESWLETAAREVREETNCQLAIRGFAGSISYLVDDTPKIVLFWHMEMREEGPFEGDNETDRRLWLTIDEALEKLTYDKEKQLLRSISGH